MKPIIALTLTTLFFTIQLTAQLAITEISYNPPEAGTDSLEYIEIYNGSSNDINLNGYKFTRGVVHTFGSVILKSKEYLLLTVKAAAFKNVYGLSSIQWTSGALDNSGERITITDLAGNVVCDVDYKDKAPWPSTADGTDGEGRSIEICNPFANANAGENWKASQNDLGFQINGRQVYGTPGANNSIPPCEQEPNATVEVSSNIFTPKDITIDVGQTVRWVNKGGDHNINGSQSTFPANPMSFGNGQPSTDLWSYDFTFTQTGFYNYQCDPHAAIGMRGTVTVKGTSNYDLYPLRTIPQITSVNTEGKADSLGAKCTLKGIVYGVNLRGAVGLQFTVIDNQNNGIGAFSSSSTYDYVVKEGDEVEIYGEIAQFNGLTQMNLDGVKKMSENNPLVTPKLITKFEEDDESSLVVVDNLSFVDPSKWTGTGSGFTMVMTNGANSFDIRIDNDIDAFSLPVPTGSVFKVTGILSQFDSSSPYNSGYQLMPRYIADFKSVSGFKSEGQDVQFSVYPNPANDMVRLRMNFQPDLVKLYDSKGKQFEINLVDFNIDLSGFPSGLYIIQVSKGIESSNLRLLKF